MPFTADELDNILNSTLETNEKRGKVKKQEIQNKPMLKAFDERAKDFPGGKEKVTVGVSSGKSGGSLTGYTHDDTVGYYNPTGTKRPGYNWREHHIGLGITHTELKTDGITVVESNSLQRTRMQDDREAQALANLLDEKIENYEEDYDVSLDALLHGDGSGDAKALAGIRSLILDNPGAGTTGGLSRTTYTWWRNRAATTAADTAGTGFAPIVSSPANGGSLLQFLQREQRQLSRYSKRRMSKKFCGSDFIDAVEIELRANGNYAQHGWAGSGSNGTVDGEIPAVRFGNVLLQYDPTLDDLGLEKRMYDIDMRCIVLKYMKGEKKKRHNPARPHNQYIMYRAYTTTGLLTADQLNSSGVYDIS